MVLTMERFAGNFFGEKEMCLFFQFWKPLSCPNYSPMKRIFQPPASKSLVLGCNIMTPRGHLAVSRDRFDYQKWLLLKTGG